LQSTLDTTPITSQQIAGDTQKLNVALASYRSHRHVGGQGIYLRHLSAALSELGHKVTVISGPPYPELQSHIELEKLPSLNLYEAPNHVTALRFHHLRSFSDIFEWWSMLTGGFGEPYCFGRRLKYFLQQNPGRFHLVHDNQSLSYGLLQLPIPVLATVHHPITRDRDQAVAAAKNGLHRWGARRWYSFLAMQTKVVQQLGYVVTVSNSSRQDIATCFGRATERTDVIFNGIDTDLFAPLDHISKNLSELITTCSSDQPVKGFDFLLDAFAMLLVMHPALRLTVVGKLNPNGPNQKKLRALGLANKVTFIHGLSDPEMVAAYNRAVVFVCPSIYEGFGLPAAEAMSCGTAVVTTDGGALPEVVGKAGIVVPAGNAKAIADAVSALLLDDKRRKKLEQDGRQRALEKFCWRRVAKQYELLYRRIIAQQPVNNKQNENKEHNEHKEHKVHKELRGLEAVTTNIDADLVS
jgi:glycosyltransferase involved in cell wall biosynthesis